MRRSNRYLMQRQFILPALTYGSLWRVFFVVAGFELVFEFTPYLFSPSNGPGAGTGAVTPWQTILEFAAFAIPFAALLILVRLFHQRGFTSLTGLTGNAMRDMVRATLWVGGVILIPQILFVWGDWNFFAIVRPLAQWASWLPFAVIAILVQVSTEEYYFRGYLQQQLGARSLSPWVWMVIPSVFFGLAHYVNGANHIEGVVWAIWATWLGIACADLTARSGNLGAAVGLHLANNIFAVVLVSVENWPGSGLALFLYPALDSFDALQPQLFASLTDLIYSLVSLWLMWLAARIAIRR